MVDACGRVFDVWASARTKVRGSLRTGGPRELKFAARYELAGDTSRCRSYEGAAIDAPIVRILDANFNRAREALRVLEEYARFVLEDTALVEFAKAIRHDLRSALERGVPAGSVRCRDIEGDVGRSVEGGGEYTRLDSAEVAVAAGKRLSEALRVIEEYGKVASGELAREVEQLRYRGYELDRRLSSRIEAGRVFGQVRLYVLVTEELCAGDWLVVAEAALDGGADCLQLREKNLPDRELLARARRLTELCRQRGALSIVNDRPDVALAAGADGVHLGQDDLLPGDARRIVGPGAIVGLSTHTIDQVRLAAEQSPDYIAVGPMFDTTTKPQEHIAGPQTLSAARRLTSVPLVAIGGIDAGNVAEVASTGCECVCVCGAVIAQRDPAACAARIREALVAPGAEQRRSGHAD